MISDHSPLMCTHYHWIVHIPGGWYVIPECYMLISLRVTAEVKNNHTGNIVCKAQGEWNGILEFTYNNGENKVIDTAKLPVIKKKIQPVEKQGQYESRWVHLSQSRTFSNV